MKLIIRNEQFTPTLKQRESGKCGWINRLNVCKWCRSKKSCWYFTAGVSYSVVKQPTHIIDLYLCLYFRTHEYLNESNI